MSERILFVDDEPHALSAYRRCTRGTFEIATAESGMQGLELLRSEGPFAVIVADMRMPGMDGIEFLRQSLTVAPDSVRMMLTGNHELQTAMEAVNRGNVFRFLTKPCNAQDLVEFLRAGLAQHALIVAEKELLELTLGGTIAVLTDMLAAADPQLGNRVQKTREVAGEIGRRLGLVDAWELDVAALLSEVGKVTIPPRVAVKAKEGRELSDLERDMLQRVPEIGSRLLARIPRLELVAEIVLYEEKHFDGTGFPFDERQGEELPLQSRILKVARDLVDLVSMGTTKAQAVEEMSRRSGRYDPWILRTCRELVLERQHNELAAQGEPRRLGVADIEIGMTLVSDVLTKDGILVLQGGTRVTPALYHRLVNFARTQSILEPILVEAPVAAS